MNLRSFAFLPKSYLGVDIGTSAIKVVELHGWGGKRSLKNFGELETSQVYDGSPQAFRKDMLLTAPREIARALRAIAQEAGMKAKNATFSIPDFSTFFTTFQLPHMTPGELSEAVRYEARRHIPVPLSQVTFDWQIIESPDGASDEYNILVVAVPKEVVQQYEFIATSAKLKLLSMEAEVFGLVRSSLPDEKRTALVIDIGAESTAISVVAQGALHVSHSVEIAGRHFSRRIATSMGIEYRRAEELKQKQGMEIKAGNTKILIPLLDQLVVEIANVAQRVNLEHPIEKLYLAGGSAVVPGLKEYFEENRSRIAKSFPEGHQGNIEIVRPFRGVFYPPLLEEILIKKGPAYATAVGAALRGFSV